MNLLSKTAPLEKSIQKMRDVLLDVGCEVVFQEQIHPLTNCYSVNLSSTETPRHIYSNGKGIESDASVASALGEYIERLQTNNFFIDFYLDQIPFMTLSGAGFIEGIGEQFVKEINGCYSAILGLPMYKLREALFSLEFYSKK